MARRRIAHVLVILLGLLYVGAGIAETVRLVRTDDGGSPSGSGRSSAAGLDDGSSPPVGQPPEAGAA